MPPVGWLVGGIEFKHLEVVLRHAGTVADGIELPAVSIRHGTLVSTMIDSLVVVLTVFFVVKVVNRTIQALEASPA